MIATLILAATLAWGEHLEWSGLCRAPNFPGCYYAISDSQNDTEQDNQIWLVDLECGMDKPIASFFVRSYFDQLITNHDWEDICAGDGKIYILDSIADAQTEHALLELEEPCRWGDVARLVKRHLFECFQMRANACFYCPDIIQGAPPVGVICASDTFWMAGYNNTVWMVLEHELIKIGNLPTFEPVGAADYRQGQLFLSQYTDYQIVDWRPENLLVFEHGPSRGHVEAGCFGWDGLPIEVSEAGRILR